MLCATCVNFAPTQRLALARVHKHGTVPTSLACRFWQFLHLRKFNDEFFLERPVLFLFGITARISNDPARKRLAVFDPGNYEIVSTMQVSMHPDLG